MPNLKSAKKRMRQNEVRREENLQVRTRVKSARRAMIEALTAGDVEQGAIALRVYHSVLDKAAKKGVLKTGNLNTKRDFIDVNDVINLMWKLINNKSAYGEVVNICTGVAVSISDILNSLVKLSGKEIAIVSEEKRMRSHDLLVHFGDNKKLNQIVGDYKFTSIKSTIKNISKIE